jgi:questin oxidase-like protein
MTPASYAPLDDALALLAPYGPDLLNGMTSHGPMAAEALCAMDRPDAVLPWVDAYRRGIEPHPSPRDPIRADDWRAALGKVERHADWVVHFRAALDDAPWAEVLDAWIARLAPGICAAATHGIIRVGHAVRSLDVADLPGRRHELAEGLAYLCATYQELPTARGARGALRPADAITRVAVVPPAERRFAGTITSSLEALADFPPFAPVIDLVDVDGGRVVSELTETFARVYLANAHDFLTSVVFVHGVTSIAAVRSLLPHLADDTRRIALAYAWQSSCALYAAFGSRPAPASAIEPPPESADTLVDMAVANGDEHAIKFTEACLREHALKPSPAYLAAARHATATLRPS